MKYLRILLVFWFFSCSKDNSTLTTTSEISFDLSGWHYSSTVFGVKYPGNAAIKTFYQFSGSVSGTNAITLVVIVDSLKSGSTYHCVQGSGSTLTVNNNSYSFQKVDDYLDVTITTYSNGTVNGTFTGKLSKAVTLSPLVLQQDIVANGSIKNASLHY